jgi:5-methylcytosine-specific restriction endonuclease McrA
VPPKKLKTLPCAHCATMFTQAQPSAIYCSKRCKVTAWRIANPARVVLHQARGHCTYYAKHCERCGRAGGRRRDWSICAECAMEVERRRAADAAKSAALAIHRAAGQVKRCEDCSAEFCPLYGYSMARLCVVCAARREKAHKLRRKALQRGVQVESVDPIKVFERDKWRCHLCGVKTPKAKRGTYADDAPELDHLLPLSQGGAHRYANVACACRRCNATKGSRPLGQLLLVG